MKHTKHILTYEDFVNESKVNEDFMDDMEELSLALEDEGVVDDIDDASDIMDASSTMEDAMSALQYDTVEDAIRILLGGLNKKKHKDEIKTIAKKYQKYIK